VQNGEKYKKEENKKIMLCIEYICSKVRRSNTTMRKAKLERYAQEAKNIKKEI